MNPMLLVGFTLMGLIVAALGGSESKSFVIGCSVAVISFVCLVVTLTNYC